jgi:hypothetical protein
MRKLEGIPDICVAEGSKKNEKKVKELNDTIEALQETVRSRQLLSLLGRNSLSKRRTTSMRAKRWRSCRNLSRSSWPESLSARLVNRGFAGA